MVFLFCFFMIYQYITIISIAIGVAVLFDFILKGVSLWHAGKNKQKGWFVALLIINSVGLLPIIYLLFFKADRVASRKARKDKKKVLKKEKEDKKKAALKKEVKKDTKDSKKVVEAKITKKAVKKEIKDKENKKKTVKKVVVKKSKD